MAPKDNRDDDDPIHDKPMPLLDHLIELRRRLMVSMAAFLVAFLVCYYFAKPIYGFLAQPLAVAMAKHSGGNRAIIYTHLTEAFFTYVRVAVFGAAFVSFPLVASQLWLFIAPGLYRSEKRAIGPFLAATPILFLTGAALAYYVVFPIAWNFFISFETPADNNGVPIELMPKISEYLDLVTKLIFGFGVVFQLPVAMALLAKVGIVTAKGLGRYRRYAYVGMFVVAAVLAPPDPISMCIMAVPLVGLYELSIIAARLVQPKPPEDS